MANRSVKGQQGESKIRKANPKSERSVQGQKSQSKVSKVLVRSRSEKLDQVTPRLSQSKVSKVLVRLRSEKLDQVSPRSARSIQGQEMPVKVSLCHNFNKSKD